MPQAARRGLRVRDVFLLLDQTTKHQTTNTKAKNVQNFESIPPLRLLLRREAISSVCERRGIDVDTINVYLENAATPLPLLTTETSWLGNKLIRIIREWHSRQHISNTP